MESTKTRNILIPVRMKAFSGKNTELSITQAKGSFPCQYTFHLLLDGKILGSLFTDSEDTEIIKKEIIANVREKNQSKILKYYTESDNNFIIIQVKVHPAFLNTGVGTILCEAALFVLSKYPNSSVTLNASPLSDTGRTVFGLESFYSHIGFDTIVDEKEYKIMFIPSLNGYTPIINKTLMVYAPTAS